MSESAAYPDPVDLTKGGHLRPVPTPPPGELIHPAQLRASTADRERVARVLQTAMAEGRITVDELSERLETVYQARTLGELEPVTRDLPEHRPLVAVPTVVPPPQQYFAGNQALPAPLPHGISSSSSAIAVMSGAERKGVWAVPATFTAIAVMGGVEIDLTEAVFTAGEVTITVFAMMGGVEIKVPDDVIVKEDGIGIMGGFDSSVPPPGELPRAIVRVRGLALMGGVEVRRLSDKERRKRIKTEQKRLDRGE